MDPTNSNLKWPCVEIFNVIIKSYEWRRFHADNNLADVEKGDQGSYFC